MLFILLFVLGMLAVPLAVDISQRGRENILVRSGRDLLNYGLTFEPVGHFLELIHVTAARLQANAAAMTLGSVSSILIMAYVFIKVFDVAAVVTDHITQKMIGF
jgi:hypothetical protein